MPIRKKIKVKGIVQGVGFRPFVYRLANDLNLKGFVCNTTDGVDIQIEGNKKRIAHFLSRLIKEKPRGARIDTLLSKELTPNGYKQFIIRKSKISKGFTQISPDIATCEDCLSELYDRHDRRHKYPLINCTNCGPRYSIISDTPYDRKRTSMKMFRMCPDCEREFNEVVDRRFHAQPDCCAVCGPTFALYSIRGITVKTGNPISRTAELLKRGRIIAIKGIGGFHIACDATNNGVVKKLRRLKGRPTKPFAIMTRSEDLRKIAYVGNKEKETLESPVAPIMLLKKKGDVICEAVAPNNPYLGVMIPYTPVHHLLLEKIPYLVMTSANIQDEPIALDERSVTEKLNKIVSFYLTHNRDIENRCDDSIGFYHQKNEFSILRRSRGYVPVPLDLPFPVEPTLAVGPYLKNTFTLADKKDAYVSPHIGDLDNLETLKYFNEMIDKYKRWFKIEPTLIVHDLHPDYLSTKIAQEIHGKKIGVQHHRAHMASCLGEHMVHGDAIGITFDGTGFGTDGKIWGGEFFVGDLSKQRRVAHLEYMPLPGGEVSIKKPYRIALAYLFTLLKRKRLPRIRGKIPFKIDVEEKEVILQMLKQEQHIVYTSSMGRLFDCMAVLLGLMSEITYEAEAAINLEYIAVKGVRQYYRYTLTDREPIIVELADVIAGVIQDIERGVPKELISAKFHNTVVCFSLDISKKLSKIYKTNKVCFSGGVFQNRYLLNLMMEKFEAAGFDVYVHRKLPTNDGCISYGQVILGNAIGRS